MSSSLSCLLNLSNKKKKKKMNRLNLDCLYLIFNELKMDSLYSCLFVNKEWYNIIVQNLWKGYSGESFHCEKRSRKIFNTILSCLPSSSKQRLSDNGII